MYEKIVFKDLFWGRKTFFYAIIFIKLKWIASNLFHKKFFVSLCNVFICVFSSLSLSHSLNSSFFVAKSLWNKCTWKMMLVLMFDESGTVVFVAIEMYFKEFIFTILNNFMKHEFICPVEKVSKSGLKTLVESRN